MRLIDTLSYLSKRGECRIPYIRFVRKARLIERGHLRAAFQAQVAFLKGRDSAGVYWLSEEKRLFGSKFTLTVENARADVLWKAVHTSNAFRECLTSVVPGDD